MHNSPLSRPTKRLAIGFALLAASAPLGAWADRAADTPKIWALELGVPDVDRAIDFYRSALGFKAFSTGQAGTWALMGNGEARLALSLSHLEAAPESSARAYTNFTVGDLESAAAAVVAAGGTVDQPARDSAVGLALAFRDPFGNPGHLIDHPWDEATAATPPAVFNFALRVHDMAAAEAFYTALGFEVGTRDYLPQTLVFRPQGVAQLILHRGAEVAAPRTGVGALLLDIEPGAALSALDRLEPQIDRTTPDPSGANAATVAVRDPSGVLLELARRGTPSATEPATAAALSPQEAAEAFESLKALAGDWQAQSTRGWDEPVTYELAAAGSVVVESNSFKDAPDRTMYTMFHMDGDRLLATHYCASGTQPRLIATGVADGGRQLTFTYLDGTSLPSRDHGHMDKAVFRFIDDDRFTSKWTWYAKGQENWMEEIEHRRVRKTEQQAAR